MAEYFDNKGQSLRKKWAWSEWYLCVPLQHGGNWQYALHVYVINTLLVSITCPRIDCWIQVPVSCTWNILKALHHVVHIVHAVHVDEVLLRLWCAATNEPILHSPDDIQSWGPQWNDTEKGNRSYRRKYLSQCHLVRHEFHMGWPGRESEPALWVGSATNLLKHGTASHTITHVQYILFRETFWTQ